MQHDLKIAPKHFEDIVNNNKSFEIREATDRYFKAGDSVLLREWKSVAPVDSTELRKGNEGFYTGRTLNVIIQFVTTYMQQKGYVVFGFYVLEDSIY